MERGARAAKEVNNAGASLRKALELLHAGPGVNVAPLQGRQTPALQTWAPDREGLESKALRSFEEASPLSEPWQ